MANSIVKAEFLGKQSWRHAWPDAEDAEGNEVAECHGAACDGESGVIGGTIVVPAYEEDGAGNVDKRVGTVEEGKDAFVPVHEEVLYPYFGEGEEDSRPGCVFGVQNSNAM